MGAAPSFSIIFSEGNKVCNFLLSSPSKIESTTIEANSFFYELTPTEKGYKTRGPGGPESLT